MLFSLEITLMLVLPFVAFSRELLAEEQNMELVLTKAFLEIDKAYQSHAHLSANGKYPVCFSSVMGEENTVYFSR